MAAGNPIGYAQEATLTSAVPLRHRSGSITGATNSTPIVVTSASHGLATGDSVYIIGVGGNGAANGWAVATVLTANTFSIPVAGSGAYTSGGTFRSLPKNLSHVGVQCTTRDVRYRDDGQAPSATVGMKIIAGKPERFFSGGSLTNLQFIETQATGVLNVTFYA